MKRLLSFSLALIIIISLAGLAYASPGTSASAAVLVHAESGQILYSQNADSRMLIASTTKIMTALVILDNCTPDEQVEILPEYTGIEGSSMYLKAGESYSVSDLLFGMLLASGNDASTALACYCGGSIEGFAAMMNEKAAELGLENTSFENPHGLDGEKQYSTAADLAKLTCKALENPLFAEIVSTKTHTVKEQTYVNHNKLLWNYEGCVSIKTGYTIAAGRTLVSCAKRDGLTLVCVTLSDPDDWKDHTALFDWAFSEYQYRNILPTGNMSSVPVISGKQSSVSVAVSGELKLLCPKGSKPELYIELPKFVYAGVRSGDVAGKVIVSLDGEQLGEFPLVYTEDVGLADGIKMTPWERLQRAWYLSNKYGFVFGKDS